MKRWLIGVIVLALIGAGGYAAYTAGLFNRSTPANANEAGAAAEPAAAANAAPVTDTLAANARIEADGRVVPVQNAALSFTRSGVLETIFVQEGDQVEAGQILARLKGAQQQVAMAQAQADLQRAEARLDELTAGPRTQEIAVAQATLSAAQARYDRLVGAGLPGNIAAAEAALAGSQASLAKVLEGASAQQLIVAEAEIANARAALKQAQSAYNLVKWRNDIGALPESARLEQATINYEAAQARLDDLTRGASQADISGASAQVRGSQAQLEELKTGMPADLAAADADVRATQAQLDLLLAGTRPEIITAAEADVAAATAALQQALISMAETELRAPFAGEIAQVEQTIGEQVTPGTTLIQLADLSRWQIETEDLTELSVVGISPNAPVSITFDAIPDLELPGKVRYVRPIGNDNRGDIVYTVIVEPDRADSRLLWNMTAVVAFTGNN